MIISGTLVNLYHVYKREMWLHANGIRMEQTSDIVYDGKLIHETSYSQRPDRYTEIELSYNTEQGIQLTGKIDYYDANQKIIHEIKRSNKAELAHEWQLKFYIWLFKLNEINGVTGILEYPKLRLINKVELQDNDSDYLQKLIQAIHGSLINELVQPKLSSAICKNCSYHDFCYINES